MEKKIKRASILMSILMKKKIELVYHTEKIHNEKIDSLNLHFLSGSSHRRFTSMLLSSATYISRK